MTHARGRIVGIGYGLLLAAIAGNAFLTSANLATIGRNSERVDHTRRVIHELRSVLLHLREAQAAKRGYVLTGDPAFARRMADAERALSSRLRAVESLAAENSGQLDRIGRLRREADAVVNEHHAVIAARDAEGLEAAIGVIRRGRVDLALERCREIVLEMEAEEQSLLARRMVTAEEALRHAVGSFAIATSVAVVLLLAVLTVERRDRANQRRATEAIRRSEDRLRLAVEATGLGTWDWDLPSGRLDWSDRCKAIYGLPPDAEVDYPRFLAAIHPEDRANVERRVAESLDPDRLGGYLAEFRIVLPDGSTRWVNARGRTVFDVEGKPARMIGTALDTTERKEVEARLAEARDEAQAASQAKDRFLAVLSHELRTPLNPVLLEVTSLLDRRDTPPTVRPSLELVRRNVEVERRLVDDLLDVVRIAQGKMPLAHEPVDAHEVIRAAVSVVGDQIQAKEIRLGLHLDADQHHLEGDPSRLQQVAWNLAANALKFTPIGGRVEIATRHEPGPAGVPPRLVIEVRDTGIGIDPEVLPEVFDPFQQGEMTITRRFGGLGLGLAICRGIVEAHGGTIEAESPGPGRGSTFRIRLPTIPEPAGSADRAGPGPGTAEDLPPRRILLVEDDPATLHVMTRLLRGLGHEVSTASTLATADDLTGDGCPFDLIISDIGLPDGSGLDLMRRVAACHRVPAVALSGFGMREDIRRSLDAGFRAHLTKPIDFARLKRVLADLVADPAPDESGGSGVGHDRTFSGDAT